MLPVSSPDPKKNRKMHQCPIVFQAQLSILERAGILFVAAVLSEMDQVHHYEPMDTLANPAVDRRCYSLADMCCVKRPPNLSIGLVILEKTPETRQDGSFRT